MHSFDFYGFELRLHSLHGERGEDELVCVGLYFSSRVLLILCCPILCYFMLDRKKVIITFLLAIGYWGECEVEAEANVKVIVNDKDENELSFYYEL